MWRCLLAIANSLRRTGDIQMKQLFLISALCLVVGGCTNVWPAKPLTDTIARVKYDGTEAHPKEAYAEAQNYCGEKKEAVVVRHKQNALIRSHIDFECQSRASFGKLQYSDAVAWRDAGGVEGAFISCDKALTDCYRRASAICAGEFKVANQSMRGAVVADIGDYQGSSITTVNNQQALAISQYGAATINNQNGNQGSFSPNAFATGVVLGQQRRALAQRTAALEEAAKEYGKLWVVCGAS